MSKSGIYLGFGFWGLVVIIMLYLLVNKLTETKKWLEAPHEGEVATVTAVGGCDEWGTCAVSLVSLVNTSCITNRDSRTMVTSKQIMRLPYVGAKVCFVKEVE